MEWNVLDNVFDNMHAHTLMQLQQSEQSRC
jgi:hypothetical protein